MPEESDSSPSGSRLFGRRRREPSGRSGTIVGVSPSFVVAALALAASIYTHFDAQSSIETRNAERSERAAHDARENDRHRELDRRITALERFATEGPRFTAKQGARLVAESERLEAEIVATRVELAELKGRQPPSYPPPETQALLDKHERRMDRQSDRLRVLERCAPDPCFKASKRMQLHGAVSRRIHRPWWLTPADLWEGETPDGR